MSVVYARETTWLNKTTQILRGEAWAADDPVVLAHPAHFTDDPDGAGLLRRTVPAQTAASAPIEQATAAPGERRNRTPGTRG